MTPNKYSTLDIVKKLKIPRERLREWINFGYIKPTIPSTGRGSKAIFTETDLIFVLIFKTLIDEYGLRRRFAAEKIQSMRNKI